MALFRSQVMMTMTYFPFVAVCACCAWMHACMCFHICCCFASETFCPCILNTHVSSYHACLAFFCVGAGDPDLGLHACVQRTLLQNHLVCLLCFLGIWSYSKDIFLFKHPLKVASTTHRPFPGHSSFSLFSHSPPSLGSSGRDSHSILCFHLKKQQGICSVQEELLCGDFIQGCDGWV